MSSLFAFLLTSGGCHAMTWPVEVGQSCVFMAQKWIITLENLSSSENALLRTEIHLDQDNRHDFHLLRGFIDFHSSFLWPVEVVQSCFFVAQKQNYHLKIFLIFWGNSMIFIGHLQIGKFAIFLFWLLFSTMKIVNCAHLVLMVRILSQGLIPPPPMHFRVWETLHLILV